MAVGRAAGGVEPAIAVSRLVSNRVDCLVLSSLRRIIPSGAITSRASQLRCWVANLIRLRGPPSGESPQSQLLLLCADSKERVMKRRLAFASAVLTLLLVSASAPASGFIHKTNGVSHGGNLLSCEQTCLIHSHTTSSNISFKIADFWDPTNKGYFYDCNCQHAHHTKNVATFWACNWDAANSSASPHLSYHTHGNIC